MNERVGQVRHWMSRHPITVSSESTISHVVHLMRARGIRHVVVMEGERLAGIVSNRDARGVVGENEPRLLPGSPVGRIMTENPVTVTPETLLTDAAREMLERKIGALPVVEGNRLVGILTKSDALEALLAWAERARSA